MRLKPVASLWCCLPLVFSLLGCTGTRPSSLGLSDGQLADCPPTPNCVSSQAPSSEHRIEPFLAQGKTPIQNLAQIIRSMPRTAIIEETDSYIHAEFTSLLWRFVDDVEFYLSPNGQEIQVRSASRLGKSDLGVNRKRVEEIRQLFLQASQAQVSDRDNAF